MESPDPRVRKQVYELTPQDFLDCPVWEFCPDESNIDGQDEATVRPARKKELSKALPGACVVAAEVHFADGSSGMGYLYNCKEEDIGCLQPNLFAGPQQVNCWLGWLAFVPNPAERVQRNYLKIGKSRDAVFPLSFRTRVDIKGKPLQASIQGFMALGLDRKPMIVG